MGRRALAIVPVAAGALVVAVVRWWVSHARRVVHMTPDEPGQLAIARFIGRGLRWNMFDHSTWRPLYGTLLAPVTRLTDDPTTWYRGGLVLNAVLGGVSCALLAVIGRRLTHRPWPVCAALATAVALSPALLLTTNWVWSESLVQATFLGFLLAALRVAERPSGWAGPAMVVLAAAGFATHSRLLVLSITAALLLAFLAWQRHLAVWRAVVLLGGLVVLLAVVSRWSQFVVDRVWDAPAPTNTAGGVLSRIGRVGELARTGVGQVWYQLVTTVGFAGLGAIALGRAVLRRGRPPAPRQACIVLAAVLPVVALSIVFTTDRWRPDHLVYGRYNDVAMAPVVLVGLAAALRTPRRRLLVDAAAVAVVAAGSAVVLWVTSDDALGAPGLLRMMVLGLLPFVESRPLDVAAVGVAAVVLIAVVAGLLALTRPGRMRTAAAAVVVAALLVVGDRRARPVTERALNTWASAAVVQEVSGDVLPRGVPVRNRLVADSAVSVNAQRQRAMLYEFYLPFNTMYREGLSELDEPTPFVFAPVDDRELARRGAELRWRDPHVGVGLWYDPSG